ncbi:MAG: phosphoribosylamine--glycine ligase/phosphoribosylformylglycinamidine cyclo-ligase [Myxococcota bacterium]|jgi:phosphoribosylamine--glycine ligase/phosphoribosylformylglycinamidine cyclo-ligase
MTEPARDQTILVVGSGGREHAIAWAMCRSPRVARVVLAPGNGAVSSLRREFPSVDVTAHPTTLAPDSLLDVALAVGATLTVIGPEAPLADGVVGLFEAAGRRVFGPSRAAAELEASKVFSKSFMTRHDIPTAASRFAMSPKEAFAALDAMGTPVVVKASGLAAGKGVFVCETRDDAEEAIRTVMGTGSGQGRFGAAGTHIVLEERLVGEEISVMAFCDGQSLSVMPAVQDHKRLLAGDGGPNTGGMGAYSPVPIATAAFLADVERRVLRPALDGMAQEGKPFKGVLYAGVMLTSGGLRVLEFNVRFGDPETQVVLPLLETDLFEVIRACTDGTLSKTDVAWRNDAVATVVAASAGYPGAYEKGLPITGVDAVADARVFQAGTRFEDGQLLTAGGRVLAVTGTGVTLEQALSQAYDGLDTIQFDGMFYRRDIGHHATPKGLSYRDAGVDIDRGTTAVNAMRAAVERTHDARVLGGVGAFGGLFDAAELARMRGPVLVASTDGVGTKTMVAAVVGRYGSLGADLVNHCINDILVQGARPLFFMDYVASSKLDPMRVAEVVGGMAKACEAAGCALLGGETAEMPGVYRDGELDVAGTIVGVVERDRIIDGSAIQGGDVVLALPSSGLHTNGYSLARRALAVLDWTTTPQGWDRNIGDTLLAPHRSYLPEIEAMWSADVRIHGLVHVTGGGLVDNPPRVLPETLAMAIDSTSWQVPPVFELIQRSGRIADGEMRRVFNLGLGMLVVVPADDAAKACVAVPDAQRVGTIVARGEGDAVTF